MLGMVLATALRNRSMLHMLNPAPTSWTWWSSICCWPMVSTLAIEVKNCKQRWQIRILLDTSWHTPAIHKSALHPAKEVPPALLECESRLRTSNPSWSASSAEWEKRLWIPSATVSSTWRLSHDQFPISFLSRLFTFTLSKASKDQTLSPNALAQSYPPWSCLQQGSLFLAR